MGRFVEAYKCTECNYFMPKFTEGCGAVPPMPYFTFNHCCPECGAPKSSIKMTTGKWTYKKVVSGPFWPLKSTDDVRDYFTERKEPTL